MRPSPDKEWEPAFRSSPAAYNEDYVKLTEELKTREIRAEDYQRFLSIETRANIITLPKFIALAYEKGAQSQEFLKLPLVYCSFCELRIDDKKRAL